MSSEIAGLGAAQLADGIAFAPGAWTVVLVDRTQLESAQATLEAELREALFDGSDGKAYRVNLCADIEAVLSQIKLAGPHDIAIAGGLEEVGASALVRLDARRNAVLGATVLFVCTVATAARVRAYAPNLWSWVGGRCFRLLDEEGTMNVARRLESLRTEYGWDDAELAVRVEAGLHLDPVLTEWLILSG